jgi:RNA polymerase sigma factor (sigma-70 family)
MTITASTDAELLDQARNGDEAAFTELYVRHQPAALRLARNYRRLGDPDDLVNGAFERVLGALRRGAGPTESFRAYLFVTLRRLAAERGDRPADTSLDEVPEPISDAAQASELGQADREMITRAFESLPDRWQAVLWHTAVEGRRPAELAGVLGVSANAAAAMAYRAREKLRQAYLQAHLLAAPAPDHEPYRSQLGAYVRKGLSKRDEAAVRKHLDRCESCRALLAELDDVNRMLARAVLPLFLLAGGGKLAAGAVAGGAVAAGASGGGPPKSLWTRLKDAAPTIGSVAAIAAIVAGIAGMGVTMGREDGGAGDSAADAADIGPTGSDGAGGAGDGDADGTGADDAPPIGDDTGPGEGVGGDGPFADGPSPSGTRPLGLPGPGPGAGPTTPSPGPGPPGGSPTVDPDPTDPGPTDPGPTDPGPTNPVPPPLLTVGAAGWIPSPDGLTGTLQLGLGATVTAAAAQSTLSIDGAVGIDPASAESPGPDAGGAAAAGEAGSTGDTSRAAGARTEPQDVVVAAAAAPVKLTLDATLTGGATFAGAQPAGCRPQGTTVTCDVPVPATGRPWPSFDLAVDFGTGGQEPAGDVTVTARVLRDGRPADDVPLVDFVLERYGSGLTLDALTTTGLAHEGTEVPGLISGVGAMNRGGHTVESATVELTTGGDAAFVPAGVDPAAAQTALGQRLAVAGWASAASGAYAAALAAPLPAACTPVGWTGPVDWATALTRDGLPHTVSCTIGPIASGASASLDEILVLAFPAFFDGDGRAEAGTLTATLRVNDVVRGTPATIDVPIVALPGSD